MMKVIQYPSKETWGQILSRPEIDLSDLHDTVRGVIADVRTGGDAMVAHYTKLYDFPEGCELKVSKSEIARAGEQLSDELKTAIKVAAQNIRSFHAPQLPQDYELETMPGVHCARRTYPIDRVGLYIPGGTAPLFSTVLMLGIPAGLAGCKTKVICTPPNKEGKIHPAILYAAQVAGIEDIYRVGGIQAVAAMAYGTETIPKVDKIAGPGNRYVTAAKQLISLSQTAIDMPAGPSEVEVIADEEANPAFVAADLLSQAEHGTDSQVLLITDSPKLIERVQVELERQLALLPRCEFAKPSLEKSKIILMRDWDSIMEMTNEYAPEHLIIQTRNYRQLAEQVRNAGSVFLGAYTPESAGDYASGTNHTLPTSGYARSYSGVGIETFTKQITFQQMTEDGFRTLAPTLELMAETEQLEAHRQAVSVRAHTLSQ